MAHLPNGKLIMATTKYFLSVDWGTTNFRLRMVECPSQKVLEEIFLKNAGVKNLFYQWKKDGGSRRLIFLNFLNKQIEHLKVEKPANTPIIISGMASSSLGLLELPYAELPFATDGENAIVNFIKPNGTIRFPIYLISGIRSPTDVIRGEETQLIGCMKNNERHLGDQLYIFPGTHSKHILVRGNQIVDFKTYMTGEIFGLLATQSVLGNSVKAGGKKIGIKARHSFEDGLKAAIHGNLLNEAFQIRTNYLFKKISKENNFYYLSGLMIGTEIKNLLSQSYDQIVVVGGSSIYPYYKMAFEMLQISENSKIFSPRAADRLVVKGQYKILKNKIQIV
jgi:2-dehydro-3-deoxygalactonokinase